MATSLNDIAVRLSVDAAGVEAGFRQARNAAVDFTRYLQKQQDEQVRTYEESFARTALEFDAHIGAYKLMLDRQLAMQTANAAEMQRVAEEKGIYAGLFKEQAALEAQRQQEANYQALKEGYRREEVSAHANARNMEEIERLKQRNVDNARNQALAQQEADYEALKASYRREEIDALNNARNMEEIERLKTRNADNARNIVLAQKEADYQALKAGYRAEEAAALANAQEMERLRKQSANNFMYGVKYGDPYDNQSDRAARRAAMAARQANDQAVLKENNALQQEATALLQKHMTVSERYLAQMKRLEVLKHTYNIQTGQMLLSDDQFARMKTNLILQTVRQQQAQVRLNVAMTGGFGGMAGAAAQASYAVEDFIQVLSMGGGLNMAMMSASNNLSMVAREMFGFGSTMSLVAGSVLPLAIVGVVSLVRVISSATEPLKQVENELDKVKQKFEDLADARNRAFEHQQSIIEIRQIDSVDDAASRIKQIEQEKAKFEQETAAKRKQVEEMQAALSRSLGGDIDIEMLRKDVYAKEMTKLLPDLDAYKQKVEDIKFAQEELNLAIIGGDKDNITVAVNAYYDALSRALPSTSFLSPDGAVNVALERIKKAVEDGDTEKLTESVKALNDAQQDATNAAIQIAETERVRLDLLEKQRVEMEQQRLARQEEMTFMLRATDVQKELYRMQKEQKEFVGQEQFLGLGGILGDVLAGQQEQDRIAFLMAQRDALLKEQEMKTGQTPIQGSLVQNAFDAQADAFKQMLEASAKKPDPQIEKTNELLRKIQEAIQNGGVIQVVP